MSEEIISRAKKLVESIASSRLFDEIYVYPDHESIVSTALLIRILSLADKEIGLIDQESFSEPSDRTLVIGFPRPKKSLRGFFLAREKTFYYREDKALAIPFESSLPKIIYDASTDVYEFHREFKEFILATYIHKLSPSEMMHRVSDEDLSKNINILGQETSKMIYGLKIMSFFDEAYIEDNLYYSIDPFVPGFTGDRNSVRNLLSNLGLGRGREYLQKLADAINSYVKSSVVSLGNKPYNDQSSSFIDLYEIIRALDIFINRDPVATTLYIASGVSGISYLAYLFRERLDTLINQLNKIVREKSFEIISHKINNTRLSEIRLDSISCERDILYETYVVLKDLDLIRDPAVLRCGDRYYYPLSKKTIFTLEAAPMIRGMFIVVDSLKALSELDKYVETRD